MINIYDYFDSSLLEFLRKRTLDDIKSKRSILRKINLVINSRKVREEF